MKISKRDALRWFEFFSELPYDEELTAKQNEIALSTFSQIETAVEARVRALRAEISGLKSLHGRTFYVGPDEKLSPGCVNCLTGRGLNAIRKTNRCNAECPFCYDFGELDSQPPIGEGLWEIGGARYRLDDIPLLLDIYGAPKAVCYVYLEPFCEIEKYYDIIKLFHQAGVHQHMYTNGIAANAENLRMLGESGLDELRFNLGATNCADRIIEKIALAKKYIPRVGVETPMTPDFREQFNQKKRAILNTGLDFMNCAELHLNPNNIDNYEGEPMYMCRSGYISPIWSHEITLRLMRMAADEGWPIAVHDCCNYTKFARDINLRAKEGGWFGASAYQCEFECPPYYAFLPVLSDESFAFCEEEPLPRGYGIDDIVI